jgi:hypothetical protein
VAVEEHAEKLVTSLRDSKHMKKDIEEAKQHIAGNYVLSCKGAGKTNDECGKFVEEMLETNLGSTASLEEVKARMQLSIFSDESECDNIDKEACQAAADEKASQMGQRKTSMIARRRAAAINEAATVKFDCVNAVVVADADYCDLVAQEAFEKLISFGYENMKAEVDKLALAMGSGQVIPLKVHKAVDTLIQVKKKCVEASADLNRLRDAVNTASKAYAGKVAVAVKESLSSDGTSCGLVLVTRFPDEATITSSEVDARALAIHSEVSKSRRVRRLFDSLIIVSSAASVTQGDAELAEYEEQDDNQIPHHPESVSNFPTAILGGICGGAVILGLLFFGVKSMKNGDKSTKTKVVPFESSTPAAVVPSAPPMAPSAESVVELKSKHEEFVAHEHEERDKRHAALQARAAAHKSRGGENVEKLANWEQ